MKKLISVLFLALGACAEPQPSIEGTYEVPEAECGGRTMLGGTLSVDETGLFGTLSYESDDLGLGCIMHEVSIEGVRR